MTFIPESDVYRLIFSSQMPAAQKFEDYVVSVILPNIRKHGAHVEPGGSAEKALMSKILANPEFGVEMMTRYRDETIKVKQLETSLEKTSKDLAKETDVVFSLARKVVEDREYTEAGRLINQAEGNKRVRCAAQIFHTLGLLPGGEKTLFAWLVSRKYIQWMEREEYYVAYQTELDAKRLVHNLYTIEVPTSRSPTGTRTQMCNRIEITPKGLAYYHNKLAEEKRDKAACYDQIPLPGL